MVEYLGKWWVAGGGGLGARGAWGGSKRKAYCHAAPILWVPGTGSAWFFLLENLHAHETPRFRGVFRFSLEGAGAQVPILFLWARGFFRITLQPEIIAKSIPKTLFCVTEMIFSKKTIPKQFFHVIL